MDSICPECGHPLDSFDQNYRFALPDAVFQANMSADSDDVWIGGETAMKADFMAARGFGYFVRSLVRAQLTDGYSITYGAWISLPEEASRYAHSQWNAPTYLDLVIEGQLANNLGPWDVLGADVIARPRDSIGLPYVESSTHPELQAVLTDTWPHELVHATFPPH